MSQKNKDKLPLSYCNIFLFIYKQSKIYASPMMQIKHSQLAQDSSLLNLIKNSDDN